jgi:hypothetical protein
MIRELQHYSAVLNLVLVGQAFLPVCTDKNVCATSQSNQPLLFKRSQFWAFDLNFFRIPGHLCVRKHLTPKFQLQGLDLRPDIIIALKIEKTRQYLIY